MAFLKFSSDSDLSENLDLSIKFLEAVSRAIQCDATDEADVAILALSQEVVCKSLRGLLSASGLL
ncbi:MAG: hypothetical protein HY795_06155 [Desulfovibrio sp.]|nr:hypothetical protein [Desulfovibrio sp.]MBI4961319.1 hypothetical protein [Desulfovibrio sp.]